MPISIKKAGRLIGFFVFDNFFPIRAAVV